MTQKSARTLCLFALCALFHALAAPASAYAQGDFAGCKFSFSKQLGLFQVAPNHYRLTGTVEQPVQIECDEFQLFADTVEHFRTEGRLLAEGHIVFVSGTNRISAERLDFNTRTRTGTFFVASGTAVMKPGGSSEAAGEQEPYAFFWGKELRKIGPSEYDIIDGAFTACVQPTPRWEVSSGSFRIKIDDHVLLRNALFKVKGVPLLYLPIFYYPMEEDDRSTGFLMPSYGTATLAGQKITNAFFWAIGRSHDATFVHDWLTKTGQGMGAQYRYALGGGSSGNARFYRLSEKETSVIVNGAEQTLPGQQSYTLTGDMVQTLPGRVRARGYVDYFSSLATQQKYQQNVYHATNRTRRYGTNLSGSWSEYVMNATLEQRDIFDTSNRLVRDGNLPRVSLSRGEKSIGTTPVYFGASGEYVTFVRKTIVDDETTDDRGLSRLDVTPTVRVPFTRWPFLSVNTVAAWRGTYWTKSLDTTGKPVDESIGRSFFDVQSRITGPIFHRIFDKGTGRKIKHVIEPSLSVQRTTYFDDYERIIVLDGADYIVGGVTRLTYGIRNRVFTSRDTSRQVLEVGAFQTYYSDERAAQYDQNYQSAGLNPSNFGAVAITAQFAPTQTSQGTLRTEWDHQVNAIRSVAASGSLAHGPWLQAEGTWSMRRVIPELPGFSETNANHYLSGSTTLRTRRNDFGGSFSFYYDMRRDEFQQQRYTAYYNAQCCGVSVEWQTWNLQGTVAGITTPRDNRFNISVTLAGIGAVPNFLGGMSGQQNRR